MRLFWLVVTVTIGLSPLAAVAQPVESFDSFIQNFRQKAMTAGITQQTYDRAMAGLTPDPNIPDLVTAQPEFTTPVWDYLDGRVSADRISRGQRAFAANEALFRRIGQQFGVDPYLLAAFWGVETDYGAVLGNQGLIRPIVRPLATLVHLRRGRVAEDEAELIAALMVLQRQDMATEALVGSWAGAVGHTQVGPSILLAHGTDGDGDGRIDLHRSLGDAIATSARFLFSIGYRPGLDWGFEVELPPGFDYSLAVREEYRRVGFWEDLGVTRVGGRQFGDRELPVFLYVPAGQNGPKFLITPNYLVIKGYNFSDSYALSVAHLTDRLKGGGPFVQPWPRNTRFPNLAQREAIQQALLSLGLYQGVVDGRIGPVTQAAYARFQAARGEVADGFVTFAAYEALVAATR